MTAAIWRLTITSVHLSQSSQALFSSCIRQIWEEDGREGSLLFPTIKPPGQDIWLYPGCREERSLDTWEGRDTADIQGSCWSSHTVTVSMQLPKPLPLSEGVSHEGKDEIPISTGQQKPSGHKYHLGRQDKLQAAGHHLTPPSFRFCRVRFGLQHPYITSEFTWTLRQGQWSMPPWWTEACEAGQSVVHQRVQSDSPEFTRDRVLVGGSQSNLRKQWHAVQGN